MSGNYVSAFPTLADYSLSTKLSDQYSVTSFTFDTNCAPKTRSSYIQDPQRNDPAKCAFGERSFLCTSTMDVSMEECQRLVNFFRVMNGRIWSDTAGWLTGSNVGNWTGITVTPVPGQKGYVSEIKLYNNNLKGTISTTGWSALVPSNLESLLI